MKSHLLRRVAFALLAMIAFAQTSIAFADCTLDRGSLAHAMTGQSDEPCDADDAGASLSAFGPLYANRCVAHCTADLQMPTVQLVFVANHAPQHFVVLPPAPRMRLASQSFDASHPPPAPVRILLHSFLI